MNDDPIFARLDFFESAEVLWRKVTSGHEAKNLRYVEAIVFANFALGVEVALASSGMFRYPSSKRV